MTTPTVFHEKSRDESLNMSQMVQNAIPSRMEVSFNAEVDSVNFFPKFGEIGTNMCPVLDDQNRPSSRTKKRKHSTVFPPFKCTDAHAQKKQQEERSGKVTSSTNKRRKKKTEGKVIFIPSSCFNKDPIQWQSILPEYTYNMLTLSFTVPGDVAPGVTTRSSGFVKSSHGMYAFKRLGTIPREPEACVFNCQSDRNWVVVFARSSGKMDPIFQEYSLEQTERGAIKVFCQSRPFEGLETAIRTIIDQHGFKASKIYLLEEFISMIGKNGDTNKQKTLYGKTPTSAMTKATSLKPLITKIKDISQEIVNTNKGIDVLNLSEIKKTELKIATTSTLQSELEHSLATLYCADSSMMASADLEEVRARHMAIAIKAISTMKDVPKQREDKDKKALITLTARQNLDRVRRQLSRHIVTLQQNKGSISETLCELITSNSPFQDACGDYKLSIHDLTERLKEKELGACQSDRHALKTHGLNFMDGLALLSVAAKPSPHVLSMIAVDGDVPVSVRAIITKAESMKSEKTPRSVELMFHNMCKLAGKGRKNFWENTMLPGLLQLIGEVEGSNSSLGLISLWKKHLGETRTMDPKTNNPKNRSQWRKNGRQISLIKGLKFLWLMFDCHHTRNGTPAQFIECMFNTAYGDAFTRVTLAWIGASIKRVKSAVMTTGFECPVGFNMQASTKADDVKAMDLIGPSLTLAVDYLWMLGEQLGGSSALTLEAKARWFQNAGMWYLVKKYSPRLHMIHEFSFVTTAQWDALDAKNWDQKAQLRYGIFVVVDCVGSTINDLTLHILDTKVGRKGGNKRDRDFSLTTGAKDRSVTINICAQGTWLYDQSDKTLFTRLYESYLHLHPETRSYTGDMKVNGVYAEIPVYRMSTPATPLYHPAFMTLEQSEGVYKDVRDAHIAKNGFNLDKKGNVVAKTFATKCSTGQITCGTRYPPVPSDYDHSIWESTPKNNSTGFFETAMNVSLAQISTAGKIEMRPMHVNEHRKNPPAKPKGATWALKHHDKTGALKKDPVFKLPTIPLASILGLPRLSGGTFTEADVESLLLIGEGVRNHTLEAKLSTAGRKWNQSLILTAQKIVIDMGLRSSKGNQSNETTEEVDVHKLFETELRQLRHAEGHGGSGAAGIGDANYHIMPKLYKLCDASLGTLQHAPKRLKNYIKEYSYDGILLCQSNLVRFTVDEADVWNRCDNPTRLTVPEQIQNMYYIESWKYLLTFLQQNDSTLKVDPSMIEHVYPKIASILGWDPRIQSKNTSGAISTFSTSGTVSANNN